jgi:hypothetical protein
MDQHAWVDLHRYKSKEYFIKTIHLQPATQAEKLPVKVIDVPAPTKIAYDRSL